MCWKIGGRRLQIFLFRRQRRRRHSVEKTAELGSCVRAINVFFFFFKKSLLSDVSVERRAPVFGSVPLSPHRHDRPPYNITPVGRSGHCAATWHHFLPLDVSTSHLIPTMIRRITDYYLTHPPPLSQSSILSRTRRNYCSSNARSEMASVGLGALALLVLISVLLLLAQSAE